MSNGYDVYLCGERMPITPSKLNLKIKGQNSTVKLINDGEAVVLKKPGLTEIDVEFVLPMVQSYSGAASFKPPEYYLELLGAYMEECTPTQFIVSRYSPQGKRLFDTNLKVSIEDYTVSEDASAGFDITVAVRLKQFIAVTTKIVSVVEELNTATVQNSREEPAEPPKTTYTVVKGDCLWAIAKTYMGDGSKYPQLYTANKSIIDKGNKGTGNPQYTIYPGQVLTIPDKNAVKAQATVAVSAVVYGKGQSSSSGKN